MHSEHSHRDDPPRTRRDRALEGAILALLIERRPRSLTLPELLEEIDRAGDPGSRSDVDEAVDGLVDVGLLRRQGSVLVPTPAAARAAEIELGLP